LQKQIADKDKQISDHQSSAANAQQQQQQNASAIAEVNNKLAQLEQDRNSLQKQNDDLVQRIIAATNAINSATTQLEELTNENFYNKSNQDVSKIIDEIEASLQEISNSIQGTSNPQAISQGGPPQIPPREQQNLNLNQVSIRGYTLQTLKAALKTRSSKESDVRGNKYNQAVLEIENFLASLDRAKATNNSVKLAIENILNNKGIRFGSNGAVMGGYNKTNKKHKKQVKSTRKQRGGFLYGKYKNTSSKCKNTQKNTTSLVNSTSSYNTTSKKYKKLKYKDLIRRKIL